MKLMTRTPIIVRILALVPTLLITTSGFAKEYAPKWCLSSQLTPVEMLICGDDTLLAAENLMSKVHSNLMSYSGKEGHEGMWYREVKSNQRDWLTQRNKSKNEAEILDAYISRIQELYRVLKVHRD